MSKFMTRFATVAAAACVAGSSYASTINYVGPTSPGFAGGLTGWMGSTVWYGAVSESNADGASRFGAPTSVVGDTIDFDPQNFEASASGSDSEIVDSQLNFMVQALGLNVIDNLQFSEAGDTTLFAFAPDVAFTSVTATFFIDVIEVDGVALGAPLNLVSNLTFVPSNGDWQTGVDGSPSISTAWTGSTIIDIEQALIDANIDFVGGATKVNVAVDNTLTAGSSGPTASAFIRKKDFDGFSVTTNIPEPASLALLGLGGLAILGRRRG